MKKKINSLTLRRGDNGLKVLARDGTLENFFCKL